VSIRERVGEGLDRTPPACALYHPVALPATSRTVGRCLGRGGETAAAASRVKGAAGREAAYALTGRMTKTHCDTRKRARVVDRPRTRRSEPPSRCCQCCSTSTRPCCTVAPTPPAMSLPPASPGAPSAAAAALAHLFDSPTPPRPTAGRGRPGNSALFLNSPTSSAGGGSPFAPSRQQASGRFELPLRGPAAAAAAAMDDGAAAAGSSTGNRTDALALFDGVDFDDAALDAEINGTAGGAGDDGLDGVVSSALNKRSVPKIDEARCVRLQR